MSNISRNMVHLVCIRNAGLPGAPGESIGGTYYPQHTNAQGKLVNARWEGNWFINHRPYANDAGILTEAAPDIVRLVAWNGKDSAGRGMADSFARIMAPGIEITCVCRINTYMGEVWDDGGPAQANIPNRQRVRLLRPDGSPIMVRKTSYTVLTQTLVIGGESDNQIKAEIAAGLRPINWFNKAHPDFQVFRAKQAAKQQEMYQAGMVKFGYAKVQLPKGAQADVYGGAAVGATVNPALVAGAVNAGVTTEVNPALIAAAINAGNVPLVENCTYEQYREKGLTDEQMLGSPLFQPFHAKINAARLLAGVAGIGGGTPEEQAFSSF